MTPETIKKIQKLIGTAQDGVWGPASDKRLDAVLEANGHGGAAIPDNYWPMLSKIESGDRPYVKASTSSGSGLYQFLRATWLGEGGQWGPDPLRAFGGLTPSVEEQTARAKTFTQKNADQLAKAGIVVNRASLYAAHFLGVGAAIRALGAAPGDKIESVTSVAQRLANPSILPAGSLVIDFWRWLERKTGDKVQ
jgi:hypothetical protein